MKRKSVIAVAAALLLGYGVAKLPTESKAQPAVEPVAEAAPAVTDVAPEVVAAPEEVEPEWTGGPIHADWTEELPEEAPAPEVYPVALSYYSEPGHFGQVLTYAVLQATTDEVVIEAVRLNRGNCSAVPPSMSGVAYPITMKFGQSVSLLVVGCDSILEATVVTPTTEFTFAGA